MLPDIPSIKSDVAAALHAEFGKRIRSHMGVIGEAPRYFIKEGRRDTTVRADGTSEEMEFQQISAETSIKFEEVPNLSFEDRVQRLDAAALQMADQMSKHAFATINSAVQQVGNVVAGAGRPFSVDIFFESLEKMQFDFDEFGQHHEITVVVPPAMRPAVSKILEQLDRDPAVKARHAQLIERKREEWRDREAARRLVG